MTRMPRSVVGMMFDPARAAGWRGLAFALLAYAGVSWSVDIVLAVLDARSRGLALGVALAALLSGGAGLFWQWRRAQAPSFYHLKPPPCCRGLILALSPFRSRKPGSGDPSGDPIVDPEDLRRRLERGWTEDDEAEIGRTNWGPLYVAVRRHAPVLDRCWILCSEASRGQFEVAKALVETLARSAGSRGVRVVRQDVEDASDVAAAARVVENIFREALRQGLGEGEVIADMTGGTAAISAGMVLATLPEGRLLQYLRQDQGNRALDLNGPDGPLRSDDDLTESGVLVALDVGVAALPEAAKREVD